MNYDFIAIPDADVPQAVEPVFQHIVTIYASEANKTVSVWRASTRPDDLRPFRRRDVGRCRPDRLAGGGETGRVMDTSVKGTAWQGRHETFPSRAVFGR